MTSLSRLVHMAQVDAETVWVRTHVVCDCTTHPRPFCDDRPDPGEVLLCRAGGRSRAPWRRVIVTDVRRRRATVTWADHTPSGWLRREYNAPIWLLHDFRRADDGEQAPTTCPCPLCTSWPEIHASP